MSKPPTVKVTYSLPAELADRVRNAVAEGAAPSYSAFAERAFEAALREEQERQTADALTQAAADPLFLQDLQDVEDDFSDVDAEFLGRGRD